MTLLDLEAFDAFEKFDVLDRHVQFEDANDDEEVCLFTILGMGIVG